MKEEPIIKSEVKIELVILLILGGIGFCTISYFLISDALKDEYPQITRVFLGAIFGSIGMYSLYCVLMLKRIKVFKNRIEISSTFGIPEKIIYLSESIKWNEVVNNPLIDKKNSNYDYLELFTNYGTYKISRYNYNNYLDLRRELIKDKKRNYEASKSQGKNYE